MAGAKSEASFLLPAVVDISTVGEIYEALKLVVQESATVKVDASKVERITTSGVQLLLSAERTLNQGGGALMLADASDAFVSVLGGLGLRCKLDEWKGAVCQS